jgi:hypothetical protein
MYCPQTIVRMIKLRKIKWAWNIACIGEKSVHNFGWKAWREESLWKTGHIDDNINTFTASYFKILLCKCAMAFRQSAIFLPYYLYEIMQKIFTQEQGVTLHIECQSSLLYKYSFMIWGCHSSEYKDGCLLGFSAVWTGVCFPAFQRSVLPLFSGQWVIQSAVCTVLQPRTQPFSNILCALAVYLCICTDWV